MTTAATFSRSTFDLAADYADCPPEDTYRKEALSNQIKLLPPQDAEDCVLFSFMLFCARGDRNKVLSDLGEAPR